MQWMEKESASTDCQYSKERIIELNCVASKILAKIRLIDGEIFCTNCLENWAALTGCSVGVGCELPYLSSAEPFPLLTRH